MLLILCPGFVLDSDPVVVWHLQNNIYASILVRPIFTMDLGLVDIRKRKFSAQCLVQRAVNLIQKQAKKTVALTMSARRIKKVGEYARQIGFPLMEVLENRKLIEPRVI